MGARRAGAILSLALGIGANTAIFSLWNGVLHSAPPGVRHPEELVMLSDPESAGMWHGNSTGVRDWLTFGEFEELRDHSASFSYLMASQSSLDRWQARFDGGDWEQVRGWLVSDGYFSFLGVSPVLGRAYGVLSYGIARRKGEFAIRIALGARPGRVIAMVLRETSVVVTAGLLAGGGLTWAAARWITSQLYRVAPQDPLTLLAIGLLLAAALGAVYLPAWRASRVDPMAALRQE